MAIKIVTTDKAEAMGVIKMASPIVKGVVLLNRRKSVQ